MSTATIIIILFVIALAAIGLIFFIQARERARIERARRLAAAEDAFQHTHRLLDEIPPQYLNQQLRHVIINRLEELAVAAKALNTRLDIDGKIADARLQLKEDDAEPGAPVAIRTPETARYIKSLLESLFRLIEQQHKARKLDASQARALLKQVLFLGSRTQADLYIAIARDEMERGHLRKAIHNYHLAATGMAKVKDQPVAQKLIRACRARIEELEIQAAGSEASTKPKGPEKSRLDEEMDELLEEEQSWKKRADFES